MLSLRSTPTFDNWYSGLRDRQARARTAVRLDRLQLGQLGDVKYFQGIGELRIDFGPGYRIYFTRQGETIILLLCGGDKSSQARDIAKALTLAGKD